LRPSDIAVALQLTLSRERSYGPLSCSVGISVGETHNAVRRLFRSRLASGLPAVIERTTLIDFLVHGVPCAYPANLGAETWGVPTAEFPDGSPFVWPSICGKVWGRAITPLYPAAPALVASNPRLYEALVLVDCIRVGDTAERQRAAAVLRECLHPPAFMRR
ncbi:MAG: hypothetical protein ABI637_10365, partial [Gemmatimonadota bacterium]